MGGSVEAEGKDSLEKYLAEIRRSWGDGKDPRLPFNVKALMENLLAVTNPDEPWMAELIRDGKSARELYRDPSHGFIQMGHVHRQGQGNAPHDHGPCWVVYGSYRGVTEITKYRRVDDGKEIEKAKIEIEEKHQLAPGVVYPYLPGEIHSMYVLEGPAVVFRFLSYDLDKVERYRYNLRQGTASRI